MMQSQLEDQGWQQFLELCMKLKTEEQFEDFFNLFLTLEEKSALTTRILLVKELLKGEKTQREISKDLKVSIAKITRGSNSLKLIDDRLKIFINKHIA